MQIEKNSMCLLIALSRAPPEFYLPGLSWSGPAIKQYLPTEVAWTDASAKAAAFKKAKTTLNEDHYRTISPDAMIFWSWPRIEDIDFELLDKLVSRILYFGRAESLTQIKRVQSLPTNPGVKCTLAISGAENEVPVLCPIPGKDLNLDTLFATTEDPKIKDYEIPPGARPGYMLSCQSDLRCHPQQNIDQSIQGTCICFNLQ